MTLKITSDKEVTSAFQHQLLSAHWVTFCEDDNFAFPSKILQYSLSQSLKEQRAVT
jgi:hypothetical protein